MVSSGFNMKMRITVLLAFSNEFDWGAGREKGEIAIFNLPDFWMRILGNKFDVMNQSLFWKQRAFNCLLDRLQGFGESSCCLLGR